MPGDVRDLARVLLPWSLVGLVIAVPAGLVLFASDSTALLSNPAFRLKLLLLLLAGSNAVTLHASGALRSVGTGADPPAAETACGTVGAAVALDRRLRTHDRVRLRPGAIAAAVSARL